MKRCSKCLKDKDESDFYQPKWLRGGLVEWCKKCRKDYGVEYREINRERIAQRKREWVERNRERVRQKNRESYYRQKARAESERSNAEIL